MTCRAAGSFASIAGWPRPPRGVVVAQRRVVGVIDVAGFVFALEVVERAEQEVALVFELVHSLTRERATSSRSASVASKRSSRRHRRKTAVSPARAAITTTTGMIHTRPATPVARGL